MCDEPQKERAQANVDRLSALADRYRRTIMLSLKGKDLPREAAEDGAQDILLMLIQRLNQGKDRIEPGLVRDMCRSYAVDYFRRNRRLILVPEFRDDEAPGEIPQPEGPSADPVVEAFLGSAGEERIRKALRQIHPTSLRLIDLHYFQGYSIREIAAIMETTVGAATMRLKRARNDLKKVMLEMGDWE
jgi:RNA polymerase sigma-70 factor, ECF subfamily